MFTRSDLKRFIRTHRSAMIVPVVVVIVAGMAAIETSGILPLEGQAVPSYGTLTTPKKAKSSSSLRAAAPKSSRKSTRVTSAASARKAGSSSSTSAWTGKECESPSSAECTAKRRAAADGDMACFTDKNCYYRTTYCSDLGTDVCRRLTVRRWAYDAFFPGCNTDECISDVSYLAADTAPDALKKCYADVLCGELLARFRKGEFECRRYQPCLDALDALTDDKACSNYPWCAAMQKIHSLYTTRSMECTAPDAACRTKIGIDKYAIALERRIDCKTDSRCFHEVMELSESLNHKEGQQRTECLIWPECKKEVESTIRWCKNARREPLCSNVNASWKFLTETRPACVFTGDSPTCQSDIDKVLK